MNVTSLHWPKDQPLTSPFPLRNGVFVALRSGDFYSPDSWEVAKVSRYRRGKVRNRPFVSARYGRFGFYLGWKVYGVDTDNQRAPCRGSTRRTCIRARWRAVGADRAKATDTRTHLYPPDI